MCDTNDMKRLILAALFFFNLFIILFFWWSNSGKFFSPHPTNIYISFGRLSGLLMVYSILIQVLLIGRTVWLEKLIGLDKLSHIHKLNGYTTTLFILLHPILLTIGYAQTSHTSLIAQFLVFFTSFEDVKKAVLAVILLLLIIFISIRIVKKRLKYEYWYFVHLGTYFAILFAWGHQLKIGEDFLASNLFTYYWYLLYIFVFGQLLFFRFITPLYNFWRFGFHVAKIVRENSSTVSIYIKGNSLKNFKVKAGQFAILKFLDKNYWWQSHPFSFSMLPNGETLRFTMKNVGDFTSTVENIKPKTPVIIDGPYGVFTQGFSTKNKYLLIAGGIGITPIRALVENLGKNGKDTVVIYSAKTQEDLVFKNELDDLAKAYKFKLFYILSQEKKDGYLYGRLNGTEITRLVKDIKERAIYICGPHSLLNSLTHDFESLGIPKTQVHYEKFSF